ncbi:hypothetical protein [Arthrobacter sp. NPDC090010]|uniref:hypothetical protein n=1 Tax=Arthrobacter sp. NPDC090010 TaxID=3363942 RepID=UPI003804F2E8
MDVDAASSGTDPAVNSVLETLAALQDAPLEEHPAGLENVHDALSKLLDGPVVPGIQPR